MNSGKEDTIQPKTDTETEEKIEKTKAYREDHSERERWKGRQTKWRILEKSLKPLLVGGVPHFCQLFCWISQHRSVLFKTHKMVWCAAD